MWIRIDTAGTQYLKVRSHLTERGIESINTTASVLAISAPEREITFLQLRFPQCRITAYDGLASVLAEFATEHPKRIVKMS